MFALPKWVTDIKKLFGTADGKYLKREGGSWLFDSPIGLPAGGISDQVLKKISAEDYDVAWADESGGTGGGGHTIMSSSVPVPQRTNLNFIGLNVSDDESNDVTTVTSQDGVSYAMYLYTNLKGGL